MFTRLYTGRKEVLFCLLAVLISSFFSVSHHVRAARLVNVSTASQLTSALQNAIPGDTIQLADGTYTGHFTATVSGTSSAPIIIQGSRNAILNGGGSSVGGYVFYLKNASYWRVIGFTVTSGQKGVMTDGANNNLIDGLKVTDIGQEGIHLRSFSSNNTIQNCLVTNTGRYDAGFGEGIYLGSANSNWGTYTGGQPDRSDNNRVLNNHLGPNITAEHIDIKEGTTGGQISGNVFDGNGMTGDHFADSWIDAKGNNYTISNNSGTKSLLDGFQVHVAISGWGNNNVFRGNKADVQASGYGFNVQSGATGTIVYTDNVVTNAGSGVANIPLTPAPSATATRTPTRTPTNTSVPGGDGSPYGGTAVNLPGTVQAENYNTGGQGVAYSDSDAANNGGQYRTSDGVDIETTTDTNGGYNVGWTAAGEWLKYTVNVQTSGTYTLNFRVASAQTGGTLHLEVDGANVTGTLTVPNTGAWQTWTTVSKTGVNLTAGQHVLRLVIETAGMNLNWLSAVSTSTVPTNTPAAPTSTSVAPTATRTPTKTPTSSSTIAAWAPNTAYSVGQLVTYNGVTYKCLQAHTSQVGWEPPNAPALWQLV